MKKVQWLTAVLVSFGVLLILSGCATQPPVVSFSADRISGYAPLTVTFPNNSIADSASWSFGDGGTSADWSPTHTFQNPGTYTVTLTATNNGPCGPVSIPKTITIVVGETPYINIESIVFSHSPGCMNLPIRVSAIVDHTLAVSYEWTSSDGHTSDDPSTTFTFGREGNKTIYLTVTDGVSEPKRLSRTLVVNDCSPDPCENPCGDPCGTPCDIDFPCNWENIEARIEPLHARVKVDKWYELCAIDEDAPCTPCSITPTSIAPQGIVPRQCGWEVRWNVQVMVSDGCGSCGERWIVADPELYKSRMLGDNNERLKIKFLDNRRFRVGAQFFFNGDPVGKLFYAYRDAHN